MPSELIFFHKGISSQARSALQEPGSLKTCVNISLDKDGEQGLRQKFTALNTTAVGAIHSICRWGDIIIIGDGTHLRYANAGGGEFTDIYGSFTDAPWQFKEFKEFLHGVNGFEEALIDVNGNCYPARIENPSTAPTLADSGSGGNPDGVYDGYVSFHITFPNGMTYETGLSTGSSDVTVSTNKIAWTAIPVSTYAAYSGTAPTIIRKLYRGPGSGGTLTDIYYVDTISDNTTTTYTDDESDAQLLANDVSVVDDYEPLPHSRFIEYHYGRAFIIDYSKINRGYFTEAASGVDADENENIMPLATISYDWDDLRVPGFTAVDPQGIIGWGTNVFIPLKQTWIKKQGNDPDSWSYKKTWSLYGTSSPYATAICPQPNGIIHLASPDGGETGLCLFNGQTSEMFTSPKFDDVFNTDLDHNHIENCQGFIAGKKYIFMYPSTASTDGTVDKLICFDLRRFPDIRACYWEGLKATCGCSSDQGGPLYLGTSDGYVLKSNNSSAEAIDIEVETDDRIGGNLQFANTEKVLKELKYNLSGTVNLQIIIDGTAAVWPDGTSYKAITGTGDQVQVMKDFPPNFKGYIYRLRVYADDLTTLTLYSPWEMVLDPKV